MAKTLTDIVKMLAYSALIHGLFVSGTDLEPDDTAGALTIRIHRMALPVHDRAITQLLDELTAAHCRRPETGHRLIYQFVWPPQPDLKRAKSFPGRIRMSEFTEVFGIAGLWEARRILPGCSPWGVGGPW